MSPAADIIRDSRTLAAFCEGLRAADFIAVDTEFMRERTFWPHLCLVQVAGPESAVAIDPLADGIDLTPLHTLLADQDVLKVFHAARQDLEIFHHLDGRVPTPLFDTQIAAMVCGFGDSVSYQALVAKLTKGRIDKSSRFTDWARRPLSDRQLRYALDDVRHLRVIYAKLAERLERSGRSGWVAEEMAALTDPALYAQHPEDAWRRIKTRSADPRFLAVLRELAAWRETEAQTRDVPRNRVLRDEALQEIAAHRPTTVDELGRLRSLSRGMAGGVMGRPILEAVARGMAVPDADCPRIEKPSPLPKGIGPVADLLKVLLKLKSEQHDVAQRLIASSADIERIAADDAADVPALHGWRHRVFGADALALKAGELALSVNGRRLRVTPLDQSVTAE